MKVIIWNDGVPYVNEAEAVIHEDGTLVIETEDICLIEPPRLQKED